MSATTLGSTGRMGIPVLGCMDTTIGSGNLGRRLK
jgi:hypothetical protein